MVDLSEIHKLRPPLPRGGSGSGPSAFFYKVNASIAFIPQKAIPLVCIEWAGGVGGLGGAGGNIRAAVFTTLRLRPVAAAGAAAKLRRVN